jgi:hypothetical protein
VACVAALMGRDDVFWVRGYQSVSTDFSHEEAMSNEEIDAFLHQPPTTLSTGPLVAAMKTELKHTHQVRVRAGLQGHGATQEKHTRWYKGNAIT